MSKQQSSDEQPMSGTSSGDGQTVCHDLTDMVMQLKSSILSLPLQQQQPKEQQPLMSLQQQMRAFSQPSAPVAPPMPATKPLKLLNMRPAGRSENLQRLCAAFPSHLKNAAAPVQEPSIDKKVEDQLAPKPKPVTNESGSSGSGDNSE